MPKLDGKLEYDAWCEAIRNGRNYVSDGYSHLMDMKVAEKLTVEARAPRTVDLGVGGSELKLDKPGTVTVSMPPDGMPDPGPQLAGSAR